jgi:integrase
MRPGKQLHLTDTVVKGLACEPGQRDRIVFDDHVKGFGVRVTANGVKTFLLQYQLHGRDGRRERYLIGRYGEARIIDGRKVIVTTAWARSEAERARGTVRSGRSPKTVDRSGAPRRSDSFASLIDAWAEEALARRSPRYQVEAPAIVRRTFAALLDRRPRAIEKQEVRDIVRAAERQYPIGTRRAVSYARAAFNWALDEKDLKAAGNPFQKVVRGKEDSRKRELSDTELGEAWRAASAMPPPFGPFFQLLILTLQRRNELAGMRWAELAPDMSLWTIPGPRTKNDQTHVVHLTGAARDILRRLPRGTGHALVFPAMRRGPWARAAGEASAEVRPISGFSAAKERLLEKIQAERARLRGLPVEKVPLPDWRFHDLRRTGATVMSRRGIAISVADRILNHVESRKPSTIVEVYQRDQFLPQREAAMKLWADYVLAAAAFPAESGNVVKLHRE